jgi:hypothetical protein
VTRRVPSGRAMDVDFLHEAYVNGSSEWEAMEGMT